MSKRTFQDAVKKVRKDYRQEMKKSEKKILDKLNKKIYRIENSSFYCIDFEKKENLYEAKLCLIELDNTLNVSDTFYIDLEDSPDNISFYHSFDSILTYEKVNEKESIVKLYCKKEDDVYRKTKEKKLNDVKYFCEDLFDIEFREFFLLFEDQEGKVFRLYLNKQLNIEEDAFFDENNMIIPSVFLDGKFVYLKKETSSIATLFVQDVSNKEITFKRENIDYQSDSLIEQVYCFDFCRKF